MENIINDLLTENRFWTFWSTDWSVKVYVQWNQKTKFKDIISNIKSCHEFKNSNATLGGYERQLEIKKPHYIFD
jgi:hypothetical protein